MGLILDLFEVVHDNYLVHDSIDFVKLVEFVQLGLVTKSIPYETGPIRCLQSSVWSGPV